jgi:DNA-directed RNA polymerase subunit RPC12/RpoP
VLALLLETRKIKNGDIYVDYKIFKCDRCGSEIEEMFPRTSIAEEDKHFCWDCSFILGHITEQEYIRNRGVCRTDLRAEVIDGRIVLTYGRRSPWLSSPKKDERQSYKYRKWRKAVLQRDGYKCQQCGETGKKLHVHHIKPFATHADLRFEVSNGITVCEACHRRIHQK